MRVDKAEFVLGFGISLRSRFFKPLARFAVVLGETEFAPFVEGTEDELCVGMVPRSGFLQPFQRLGAVLRDTVAAVIEVNEQGVLRLGITSFREGLPVGEGGGVIPLFAGGDGGLAQGLAFFRRQGIGGACGEEEGEAEGFIHGGSPCVV